MQKQCMIQKKTFKEYQNITFQHSFCLSLSSLWEGLEWPHVGRQRLAVAPGRRAGAVAHGNQITGGREAVWFIPQLQQMAATEVCLSSLHSRAGCQDRASHTQEEEEGAGSWTHARRMFSDSGCLTTPLTPFQPHTHTKPHISQTCTHIFLKYCNTCISPSKLTQTHSHPLISFFALFISVRFHSLSQAHFAQTITSTVIHTPHLLWLGECSVCEDAKGVCPNGKLLNGTIWSFLSSYPTRNLCSSFKVIIHREKDLVYPNLTMHLQSKLKLYLLLILHN